MVFCSKISNGHYPVLYHDIICIPLHFRYENRIKILLIIIGPDKDLLVFIFVSKIFFLFFLLSSCIFLFDLFFNVFRFYKNPPIDYFTPIITLCWLPSKEQWWSVVRKNSNLSVGRKKFFVLIGRDEYFAYDEKCTHVTLLYSSNKLNDLNLKYLNEKSFSLSLG